MPLQARTRDVLLKIISHFESKGVDQAKKEVLDMVTVKDIEKRIEHQRRLELAGVTGPKPTFGLPVILWVRTRGGSESWEVMGEWEANLVVSDLHNDATAERAAVYHRIPKNAPLDVAARWLQAKIGLAAMAARWL